MSPPEEGEVEVEASVQGAAAEAEAVEAVELQPAVGEEAEEEVAGEVLPQVEPLEDFQAVEKGP